MAEAGRDPLTPHEFFAAELRQRREEAGLSQSALGELVVCSPSLIAQFEAGRRRPRWDDVKRLDAALGTGNLFTRLRRTLEDARFADHFAEAAEAEQQATMIETYAGVLIPGLLQTEGYAREVFRTARPHTTPESLEALVVNRLSRTEILADPATPVMWAILSEEALRRPVGGHLTMAEQVVHLAHLGRGGRVLLQVMPLAAGAHALMECMLNLYTLPESPDLAYADSLHSGTLFDDPASVARLRLSFDLARASALAPDTSLDFLDTVIEEHRDAA